MCCIIAKMKALVHVVTSDPSRLEDYDGPMNGSIIFGIAALLTLLPAVFLPSRRASDAENDAGLLFWMLVGVATIGPAAFEIAAVGGIWRSGFSATLWTIVSSTMILFFVVCLISPSVRRLRVLLVPYVVILAVIALLWSSVPDSPLSGVQMTAWLQVHIGISLITYALITLAATAALAVWLKERALRKRTATAFVDSLPAVADGERIQRRLLIGAEIILGLGLLTGMATQFFVAGTLVELDHKTTLSIAAFVVLGVLLLMQQGSGLRGRSAARFVLIIYLLITLAFPGVKFVTDVIIS